KPIWPVPPRTACASPSTGAPRSPSTKPDQTGSAKSAPGKATTNSRPPGNPGGRFVYGKGGRREESGDGVPGAAPAQIGQGPRREGPRLHEVPGEQPARLGHEPPEPLDSQSPGPARRGRY